MLFTINEFSWNSGKDTFFKLHFLISCSSLHSISSLTCVAGPGGGEGFREGDRVDEIGEKERKEGGEGTSAIRAKRLFALLLSNWFSHVSFAFNIRCFSNVAVVAQEWKFCCTWFRIKKIPRTQ